MSLYNSIAIQCFLEREFSRFPTKQRTLLLDLGCGIRPYHHLYRDRFEKCIAGDYDVRTVLDVRLDAARLPFRDSTADVMLFTEVVEHLPDARLALQEIGRVLKPTGLLLITWPFNYMLHEIPRDYSRFTEFGMAEMLAESGMEIELMVRRGGVLTLCLALSEYFVDGLLELCCPLPIIGRFLRHGKEPFLRLTFGLVYRALLRLSWHGQDEVDTAVGSGLKGIIGQMNHWTLGYCCRVRKRPGAV